MFHPGKVLNIYREKSNTQATVEMWDENLFTFHVANSISSKIKKDDVVLVDYRPVSDKVPIPKQLITKILNKNDISWNIYKTYFRKKKAEALKAKKQKVGLVPVSQSNSLAG